MKKKTLSALLAVIMAVGTFLTILPISLPAHAEETTTEVTYQEVVAAALTTTYTSAQNKLDADTNMKLVARYDSYELYANTYTGEIGFKDVQTGQILLSNPYNVPSYTAISADVRKTLLSQIVVGYNDSGVSKTFYSYTEAAARGQIDVVSIKNGVRLEYAIGRKEANYLCPGMITEVRMISMLLSNMYPTEEGTFDYSFNAIFALPENTETYQLKQFLGFYTLYDIDDSSIPATQVKEYLTAYPVLESLRQVYVRNTSNAGDLRRMENYVKEHCPDYTYEEMEKDHAETKYVSDELDPPLFKLALEYTLTSEGLNISLPANGIRFNYSLYQLEYITPLEFFGAGDLNNEGYLFYPDGGGAIFYFDDLITQNTGSITGKVYGPDYAYHQISGQHQESIRVPAYGIVQENAGKTTGYLAILDEGDAMSNITASWGGSKHNYVSAYTTFYPRPRDTYDLSDTVSVGGGSSWTVESSRKYTGNYQIRIMMLSDSADKATLTTANRNYFEASYVGMAKAYSHYLTDVANVLTPLSSSDVKDGNLPLYLESFGTVHDTERILSIPVDVNVPLTTFDDLKTMYEELSDNGITNVQFILTGFANGGMYSTYPNQVSWMNEVGGADGFKSFLAYAQSKGFGVYPDFDFMYVTNQSWFDGVNLKYAAARTIDNRYSNRRVYDVTYQEFVSYFDICVTPVMVQEYYQKFTGQYKQYSPLGISVSTLGSDLNSDFGDRVPTNREDAKQVIKKIFATVENDYSSVLTSGGNAYALASVSHLIEAAVDSSRFAKASRSVPFVGMVLHGYVNFAGSAINMAGNYDYEILRAIENGASVYFTLSYRNTELLKSYEDLSQYYSVNYKIWAGEYDENGNLTAPGDIFDIYNRVNDAIGDLQTSLIVNHQFLKAERVPTAAEAANDQALFDAAMAAAETAANNAALKAKIAEYRAKFKNGEVNAGEAVAAVATTEEIQAVFDSYQLEKTSTASNGDDAAYESTKYTLDNGKLVLVDYEGGVSFLLNYNMDSVTVRLDGTEYTLGSYEYLRINR